MASPRSICLRRLRRPTAKFPFRPFRILKTAPGYSLGDAVDAIVQAETKAGLPNSFITSFQGTAAAFQSSLANEIFLIIAAVVAMYIVLGVLYESFIHPITILSTLPSAG